MVQHYYRNVHAIVIVYDVTNKSSFNSLGHWIEECDKHCFLDIPRILVGNKCDEHMAVNTNLAQRIADQHHMPVILNKIIVVSRYLINITCSCLKHLLVLIHIVIM